MSGNGGKANRAGVLICGAYGMRNAGDEAVLDAILAEMRSIDPDMPITVLSRNPAETRAQHGVEALHTFDLPGFLRAMRRCELYVNGGGSLIQDVTSSRSLWYYLYTLSAAKKRGCKVMMYGCGVGPVNRPANRRRAGRVIDRNVDAITLREKSSLNVLRSLGVTKPEIAVAAEPALSLERAPDETLDAMFRDYGMEKDGHYFCICVRRWRGMREKLPVFAAAADYAWEKYGMTPVLLSVNRQQDDDSARQLRELSKAPCVVVTDTMRAEGVIGFLSRMDAVLAMRLHPLIFSASQSVPLIGVSYDPKVSAFLDDIDQTNYIEYDALTRAEQLYPMIDAAAHADREALREATARLRKLERRNVETARRLLMM